MYDVLGMLHELFGIHHKEVLFFHMFARAVCVYILGIILVRLDRRFMTMRTSSNFFLYILLGSVLATAIVGKLFYEILGMAILIMALNWFIGYLEYILQIRHLIEGEPVLLIENGKINHKHLRWFSITEKELIMLLRLQKNTDNLNLVDRSYFEINGEISFIMKSDNKR